GAALRRTEKAAPQFALTQSKNVDRQRATRRFARQYPQQTERRSSAELRGAVGVESGVWFPPIFSGGTSGLSASEKLPSISWRIHAWRRFRRLAPKGRFMTAQDEVLG